MEHDEQGEHDEETVLEKMHDSGVGTSDPNIAPQDEPTIQEVEPGEEGTLAV